MNILDKAIGWLSPEAGAKRARARVAMGLMTRSYEGAVTGRRTDGWNTSGTSANAEIGPALARLRSRSRDLVRNNPYAARVVDIWAANVVGTGIMPQSRAGDDALDRRVDALFQRWSAQCDAEGQLDFAGLQALVMRTVVEGGEVLARHRNRRPEDRLPVPYQVQVLEGDYLDASRDSALTGRRTIQGVEFDPLDRRTGYWLFNSHPGDPYSLTAQGLSSNVVDASEVMHVYRKLRTGQVRGVPWFAPVLLKARDLDDFHEAAIVRARMEACIGMVVTQADDGGQNPIGVTSETEDGRRVEGMEPGMVPYLRPGESVEFLNPTASPSFDPFTLHALMAMAVGTGVTYDQMTGDLRQANYSSLRAGKVEFRRLVEQAQWQMLIPMFCAPVWRRFIETAILSGSLPAGEYPVEWSPPAHEPIDPVKDMTADILAVRTGRYTWDQFVARWGYDPKQQLADIARINAAMDDAGVVLDTDPRKVTKAGGAQQGDPSNA
ncbi:phage portal protein [Azospirillum sp. B21]|uniref:phage portal protein n=1 Tax=Azospirillum sp. B21 TaxID=2607496 RepID=UPI0011ED4CD1|nr:phage portal protein [Azospirillum sp. B21]KAA0572220.1 phage portal protein [Azospirillum sp. B21]